MGNKMARNRLKAQDFHYIAKNTAFLTNDVSFELIILLLVRCRLKGMNCNEVRISPIILVEAYNVFKETTLKSKILFFHQKYIDKKSKPVFDKITHIRLKNIFYRITEDFFKFSAQSFHCKKTFVVY